MQSRWNTWEHDNHAQPENTEGLGGEDSIEVARHIYTAAHYMHQANAHTAVKFPTLAATGLHPLWLTLLPLPFQRFQAKPRLHCTCLHCTHDLFLAPLSPCGFSAPRQSHTCTRRTTLLP